MLRGAGRILLIAAIGVSSAFAGDTDFVDLPLGDGAVSLEPAAGHVFACRRAFDPQGQDLGVGWVHADDWTPSQKPIVSGRSMWPLALFHLAFDGESVVVDSNGLPIDVPTGAFPMDADDADWIFDPAPYAILPQRLHFEIPRAPFPADRPGCLPAGMIGFTITGVAFYSAIDSRGRDAAAHELLDFCSGRPTRQGHYHYYGASPCLPGSDRNALVGWALDGFPIMGLRDASGRLLTNSELDECHGRREFVQIGPLIYGYAYRLTREFPYTLGCFRGAVRNGTLHAIRSGLGPRPQPVQQSGSVLPTVSTSTAHVTDDTHPQ